MGKMTVNYIGIKNILGIESLEFEPGKINSIDGANGVGKTSFLNAIKAVVGGGHDGTLLRKGKDQGEIVLILDNGMKLTKKIGKEKSSVSMQDAEGLPVKRAASFLKDIIDGVGLNPIQILTASPKDRVDILLQSVPLTFPDEALKKAGIVSYLDDVHPLKALDDIKKDFFEQRAIQNKQLKEKQIMVDQMAETMPFGEDSPDYDGQLVALEKAKSEAEKERDIELDMTKSEKENLFNENNKILQSEIEKARKFFDDKVENLRDYVHKEEKAITRNCEAACAKIRLKTGPILEEMAAKIATVKEKDANSEKVRIGREYVKEGQKAIKEMQTASDDFTGQLKSLAKIKKDLLGALPIKGLEIIEGDICLDGVLFDHVNEGKRIQFVLDVAGISESELPLVCVDGLEALDPENFKMFCQAAEKTDMQFFVTRVTDEQKMSLNKMALNEE